VLAVKVNTNFAINVIGAGSKHKLYKIELYIFLLFFLLIRGVLLGVENFPSVTSDVLWDVGRGFRILIKKLIT
jgi:hypothetical protein